MKPIRGWFGDWWLPCCDVTTRRPGYVRAACGLWWMADEFASTETLVFFATP